MQKYPIGQQDFPSIIKEGKVYVDKTVHAFNLINNTKSNTSVNNLRFKRLNHVNLFIHRLLVIQQI